MSSEIRCASLVADDAALQDDLERRCASLAADDAALHDDLERVLATSVDGFWRSWFTNRSLGEHVKEEFWFAAKKPAHRERFAQLAEEFYPPMQKLVLQIEDTQRILETYDDHVEAKVRTAVFLDQTVRNCEAVSSTTTGRAATPPANKAAVDAAAYRMIQSALKEEIYRTGTAPRLKIADVRVVYDAFPVWPLCFVSLVFRHQRTTRAFAQALEFLLICVNFRATELNLFGFDALELAHKVREIGQAGNGESVWTRRDMDAHEESIWSEVERRVAKRLDIAGVGSDTAMRVLVEFVFKTCEVAREEESERYARQALEQHRPELLRFRLSELPGLGYLDRACRNWVPFLGQGRTGAEEAGEREREEAGLGMELSAHERAMLMAVFVTGLGEGIMRGSRPDSLLSTAEPRSLPALDERSAGCDLSSRGMQSDTQRIVDGIVPRRGSPMTTPTATESGSENGLAGDIETGGQEETEETSGGAFSQQDTFLTDSVFSEEKPVFEDVFLAECCSAGEERGGTKTTPAATAGPADGGSSKASDIERSDAVLVPRVDHPAPGLAATLASSAEESTPVDHTTAATTPSSGYAPDDSAHSDPFAESDITEVPRPPPKTPTPPPSTTTAETTSDDELVSLPDASEALVKAMLAALEKQGMGRNPQFFLNSSDEDSGVPVGCTSPSNLLVSLSGGVDSICHLGLLSVLQKRGQLGRNVKLAALHLRYSNRSEQMAEERWVSFLCEKLGVPLFSYHITLQRPHGDVKTGLDRARYEEVTKQIRFRMYGLCFEAMTRGTSKNMPAASRNFVVIGHHQDDLDENRLAEMGKGSIVHLDGCATLLPVDLAKESGSASSNNVSFLFRPLLAQRKSAFLAFNERHRLPYMRDSTPKWSRRGWTRRVLDWLFCDKNPDYALPGGVEIPYPPAELLCPGLGLSESAYPRAEGEEEDATTPREELATKKSPTTENTTTSSEKDRRCSPLRAFSRALSFAQTMEALLSPVDLVVLSEEGTTTSAAEGLSPPKDHVSSESEGRSEESATKRIAPLTSFAQKLVKPAVLDRLTKLGALSDKAGQDMDALVRTWKDRDIVLIKVDQFQDPLLVLNLGPLFALGKNLERIGWSELVQNISGFGRFWNSVVNFYAEEKRKLLGGRSPSSVSGSGAKGAKNLLIHARQTRAAEKARQSGPQQDHELGADGSSEVGAEALSCPIPPIPDHEEEYHRNYARTTVKRDSSTAVDAGPFLFTRAMYAAQAEGTLRDFLHDQSKPSSTTVGGETVDAQTPPILGKRSLHHAWQAVKNSRANFLQVGHLHKRVPFVYVPRLKMMVVAGPRLSSESLFGSKNDVVKWLGRAGVFGLAEQVMENKQLISMEPWVGLDVVAS